MTGNISGAQPSGKRGPSRIEIEGRPSRPISGGPAPDPAGLLEGTGKHIRHVNLRPADDVDTAALVTLFKAAYSDMTRRLEPGAGVNSVAS